MDEFTKNIGIFSLLVYRDNKVKYLKYIPELIKRCIDICNKNQESVLFINFFQQ